MNQPRKTTRANLEVKRPLYRALSFIAALSFILAALSWTTFERAQSTYSFQPYADLTAETPPTVPLPPPPPLPEKPMAPLYVEGLPPLPGPDDDIPDPDDLFIQDVPFLDEFPDDWDDEWYTTNKVLNYAELMPAFGSCLDLPAEERNACAFQSIGQVFRSCLKYPAEAARKGISGTVHVYFVVGVHGEIDSARIVQAAHPLLDAEVLRALECLPRFEPGSQNGKKVAVGYTMPAEFTLR